MNLYNPLTYDGLMISLTTHFGGQQGVRLDDLPDIQGSGIYALYYTGLHPVYQQIAKSDKPIYVGKTASRRYRKGGAVNVGASALATRLSQHANSIAQVPSLNLADFWCRYLAVDPVWINLTEQLLIDRFKPVWNRCLTGFGNHAPGSGRAGSELSWWDTLHPGRTGTEKLKVVKTQDAATARVESYLAKVFPTTPPPAPPTQ